MISLLNKNKIAILIEIFIFSVLFLTFAKRGVYGQACSSTTCLPCSGETKCIFVALGNWQCAAARQEAQTCTPLNLCNGGECTSGLDCKRAGFGDYVCVPPGADPNAYQCNPWTCSPCDASTTCVNVSFGTYRCQPRKNQGVSCAPVNICGECAAGLSCSRMGFGAYACLPSGANPGDYLCNPWTNEPCTSGEQCIQVSIGSYACQALNPTPNPTPSGGTGTAGSIAAVDICKFVTDSTNNSKCTACFTKPGVYTPFGCIETTPQLFVQRFLTIAIGLGGGIAFLMIIYGGFTIMMSSGNPEKLNSGKEIITSAIAGLLLIVFSVVILKIIGVDIFKIPGLSQ